MWYAFKMLLYFASLCSGQSNTTYVKTSLLLRTEGQFTVQYIIYLQSCVVNTIRFHRFIASLLSLKSMKFQFEMDFIWYIRYCDDDNVLFTVHETQPYWILLIFWRVGEKLAAQLNFGRDNMCQHQNAIREMLLAVGMLIENAANKRIIGKNLWSSKWTNGIGNGCAILCVALYICYLGYNGPPSTHSKSFSSLFSLFLRSFLRSKFIHRFHCLNDALRTQTAPIQPHNIFI